MSSPAASGDTRYGSSEWLEQEYTKVAGDPWGLSWRTSQLFRYGRVLAAIDRITSPLVHVMDVGCAIGDFTSLLARHTGTQKTVLGVDCAEIAIKRAKSRFPGLTFTSESILFLGDRFSGQFDLVTCLEVIYYVDSEQQADAITSIKAALRPGGYAVFSSFISSAPHFTPGELVDLLNPHFELVYLEILHLRLVNLLEKAATRAEALISKCAGQSREGCLSGRDRLPLPAVVAIERLSRLFGRLTASHALVLARSHI